MLTPRIVITLPSRKGWRLYIGSVMHSTLLLRVRAARDETGSGAVPSLNFTSSSSFPTPEIRL